MMGTSLSRDRAVALSGLILVTALAWLYLWREAAMMTASMPDMPMNMVMGPVSQGWSTTEFLLTFLMWSVMMVGMMLPSAAPAMLLYGTMVRRNAERGVVLTAVWTFVAGYLAAWTVFSLAATILQIVLQHNSLMTMRMASASVSLTAGILVIAGIYQWLPVKHACLHTCRHPLQFFVTRWRSGRLGAWRMGWEHGWFCVGCCWALMLVLFVAGVMSLLWVAVIAAFVFIEKVLPASALTTRAAGIGLIISGLMLPVLA